MSDAPVDTSPAAKSHGCSVWRVLASTLIRLPAVVPTSEVYGSASGPMPMVVMTMSVDTVYSLFGTGSGRRRPEASGSPRRIFCSVMPVTLPPSDTMAVGFTRNSKVAPSASASLASTWCAGISSRPRR